MLNVECLFSHLSCVYTKNRNQLDVSTMKLLATCKRHYTQKLRPELTAKQGRTTRVYKNSHLDSSIDTITIYEIETINTLPPLTDNQVSDLLEADTSHSISLNLDADGFESELMSTYEMEESWEEIRWERGGSLQSSVIALEDMVDLSAMEAVDRGLVSVIEEANIRVLQCGGDSEGWEMGDIRRELGL